jgi:cation-transporting ATPase E
MIPEGLMVLTSVALAAGVYKLAKKRTLVQDLYSIETLARVDVLCLDKTGTITEGSMQVEKEQMFSEKYGNVNDILGNMVKALGPNNATFEAFQKHYAQKNEFEVIKTIPFSSARKWSAVNFGINGTFIVGAPEFVLKHRFTEVKNDCEAYAKEGYRVLALVTTKQALTEEMDPDRMTLVALVVLSDKIRENAKVTFEYFAEQGVTLKVISGDNPVTVSKVAERAGLTGADKYIDATELDTEEKVYDACDKYTIFGRVTPKQKKQLVQALKSKGYTVGMTGDGVNDVMALKEADCSIAMAAGSEASRAVAQLVLLDSDFASLPSVVSEGRRVINNIERSASLFLVKTTFSALLSILCIAFMIKSPFEPIHLTLVSALFVGIPSFFLALEPNNQRVTGGFLSKVFKKALPAGFTITLLVFLISYTYSNIGYTVSSQVGTMATYIYAMVSFVVLAQVCLPYTKERLFLMAIMLVAFIWCISTPFMAAIFSLYSLTSSMTIKLVICLVCVVPTMLFMRVEIEAVTNLIREVKKFFKKNIKTVKKFLKKEA